MAIQQIWTHGNAGLLERKRAPSVNRKSEVNRAFHKFDGDIVNLGGFAAAAFLRIGFEGRVVIYDHGDRDFDKSGEFWLHYALPTVITPGARVRKVMVRFRTDNLQKIAIRRIHMWDGNRERVFADDDVDENMNYERSFNNDVQMGLCVSMLVRANNANDDILQIFGVGAEVEV